MKQREPLKTVNSLIQLADGSSIEKSERCCGESGTLAIARPDISTQIRFRKQEELIRDNQALRSDGFDGPVKVLTSCPSCLQGLNRFEDDVEALEADYIDVEIARHQLGATWLEDYVKKANQGGIERILV